MEGTSSNWPPVGFRFTPTDEQVVTYYLKPKNDGLLHDCYVIPDYDIYSCLPKQLPRDHQYGKRNEWYFFVGEDGAKSRKVGPVKDVSTHYFWRATGQKRTIQIKEIIVQKMILALYLKRGNKRTKMNWMMHEYSLVNPSSSTRRASGRKGGFRFCRIYSTESTGKKNETTGNKGKIIPPEDDAASPASTDSSWSYEDLTSSPVEILSQSNTASPDPTGFPCNNEDLAVLQPKIPSDLVTPIQGSSGFSWSVEGLAAYVGIPLDSNAALAAGSSDFHFNNEDPTASLPEIPSEFAATGPGSPDFYWKEEYEKELAALLAE